MTLIKIVKQIVTLLYANKSTVFRELQMQNRKENMLSFAGDARYTQKAIDRYHFAIYTSWWLAAFGLAVSIVEHEFLLEHGDSKDSSHRLLLLWINLFITIALAINIYFTHKCWFWWQQTLGKLGKYDDMLNSKLWKLWAIEIAFNLVSPMPFLYKVKYEDYYYGENIDVKLQVNTVLLFLMFIFRIYHFKRSILISTHFMNDRATRVWSTWGVNNGYKYWMRAVFKENPLLFCYANYAFYTIYFGYLFRAIESEANDGNISEPYFTLNNSMWCSFITMTTVGYGDFFPNTILGRFVGYWSAFVGVALESLVILSVQSGLMHTVSQFSSYLMLISLSKKETLKKRAGEMLVATYRLRHWKPNQRESLIKKYK